MANRKKKKRGIPRGYVYIGAFIIAIIIIAGAVVGARKYAPTKEHLDLANYFSLVQENQTAVVLDNEYMEVPDSWGKVYAINQDGNVYLELEYVKENLDDGYVYDPTEITLRYATDTEVYTATIGSSTYLIDKSANDLGYNVLVAGDDTVYISIDYIKLLTDIDYRYYENPSRVFVERAGLEKKIAKAKGGQIRKLNGPKSPILEDLTKGEDIIVVRDTGKWSFVVSSTGVMGYMKNSKLSDAVTSVNPVTLPERSYNHISLGKSVCIGWHQVTGTAANADIANVLAGKNSINVMSPTWFYLKDNNGGIANLASKNYVDYCHEKGIQVWALVSNLEADGIDTTAVLNTTSSRDALVNNLVAAAITYGLDGINIDIEELQSAAADGYIQFIRELSIKCEKNDIILSVDNYVPSPSSGCYNRAEQAKYADYIIIMGYDEHYGSSQEAGSVASLPWVTQGVADTIDQVPAEQVVLGMPFYCRVWTIDGEGAVSSKAYGMSSIQSYLASHGAKQVWNDELGQYYAEYESGDNTYKIWVEDPDSLEAKLSVMKEYNLAGAAFWKLGFDNDAVWNSIAKYF